MRWRTWLSIAAIVVLAVVLLGQRTTATTQADTSGGWNRERLTWYGPHFYGNTTACGVTMTRKLIGVAAHGSGLPCGTLIEIRVHRHGHVVHDRTVVVLDHGPYGVAWHLDATARLMIHLAGHPPHSLNEHRVKWRVVGYEVW